ncbi:MAG: carbohydrate ABC transporter permease [Coprococcus sp.]
MVITLASLTSISDTFYEAAKVDGATKWDCLTKITLPLLKPTIIMNIFLSTISAMQVFDMVYTMTGGGPSMSTTTLSMYACQTHFFEETKPDMLWPFPMY